MGVRIVQHFGFEQNDFAYACVKLQHTICQEVGWLSKIAQEGNIKS